MSSQYLLQMLCAFGLTILVEASILLAGLSRIHPWRRRLFAGVWLSACTYPIVWLTIPAIFPPERDRTLYLAVAETFAPVAEGFLFWWTFDRHPPCTGSQLARDMLVILVANLASFAVGALLPAGLL
ncbi:MAG: hypothetical protein ACHRHE_12155 [Tepidisphaerales bacterium]